jgi:hypothetical protein
MSLSIIVECRTACKAGGRRNLTRSFCNSASVLLPNSQSHNVVLRADVIAV